MPRISACIKEKAIRAWCQPAGTGVVPSQSLEAHHSVLPGDWVSQGTAEVTVPWGKRETRQPKSVGKQAVYFCGLCKVFSFL